MRCSVAQLIVVLAYQGFIIPKSPHESIIEAGLYGFSMRLTHTVHYRSYHLVWGNKIAVWDEEFYTRFNRSVAKSLFATKDRVYLQGYREVFQSLSREIPLCHLSILGKVTT